MTMQETLTAALRQIGACRGIQPVDKPAGIWIHPDCAYPEATRMRRFVSPSSAVRWARMTYAANAANKAAAIEDYDIGAVSVYGDGTDEPLTFHGPSVLVASAEIRLRVLAMEAVKRA